MGNNLASNRWVKSEFALSILLPPQPIPYEADQLHSDVVSTQLQFDSTQRAISPDEIKLYCWALSQGVPQEGYTGLLERLTSSETAPMSLQHLTRNMITLKCTYPVKRLSNVFSFPSPNQPLFFKTSKNAQITRV